MTNRNPERSRTEIILAIRDEGFHTRHVFCERLDQLTAVTIPGTGERVKVAWPHAVLHLSLEDWNDAYWVAIAARDAQQHAAPPEPEDPHSHIGSPSPTPPHPANCICVKCEEAD